MVFMFAFKSGGVFGEAWGPVSGPAHPCEPGGTTFPRPALREILLKGFRQCLSTGGFWVSGRVGRTTAPDFGGLRTGACRA